MRSKVQYIRHLLERQKIVKAEAGQAESKIKNYDLPSYVDRVHMHDMFFSEEVFMQLEEEVLQLVAELFSEQFMQDFPVRYYPNQRIDALELATV